MLSPAGRKGHLPPYFCVCAMEISLVPQGIMKGKLQ